MDSHFYRIKKSFLFSLCVIACLLVIMLGLSLYYGPSVTELIVLGIILCASAAILLECCYRSVTVGLNGLTIKRFFKTREIPWDMVHQVGMMIIRRKCYLILTTGRGFHIFSSSYGNFTDFVRNVVGHVSSEYVDENVQGYVEDPVESHGDVYSAGIAVILVLALITMKVFRII